MKIFFDLGREEQQWQCGNMFHIPRFR